MCPFEHWQKISQTETATIFGDLITPFTLYTTDGTVDNKLKRAESCEMLCDCVYFGADVVFLAVVRVERFDK